MVNLLLRKGVIELLGKTFILPILGAIFLVGTVLVGSTMVSAQDMANPHQLIAQKIAQRFNLNQGDVQKVFDEVYLDRQNQLKIQVEAKLNQAVQDKKITEAQKQAILKKLEEFRGQKPVNLGQFQNLTMEQKRQAMEQKRTELEDLAKDNGLTIETLQSLMGHKGMGFGMRGYR